MFSFPALMACLEASVLLRIQEIQRMGYIPKSLCEELSETGQLIANKGDILLYGGSKKGETSEVFNRLARAIALMAFSPGGITISGMHFEAHFKKEEESCPDTQIVGPGT